MATQRAHFVLPQDLLRDIKKIAGPRGSSAFVAEILRAEVRKRKLLEFLEELRQAPAWKDEDHPELVKLGTANWVRAMRSGNNKRLQRAEKTRSRK